MLDTKLNRYIKGRGYTARYIAQQLGISRQALWLKMRGEIKFTEREQESLKGLLKITAQDAREIF